MKWFAMIVTVSLFTTGCAEKSPSPPAGKSDGVQDKVQTNRNKLAQEDRALVDAQDECPISGERLGTMGVPVKVTLKGQPVFLCCSGCEKKANDNADKTLARVGELKARKKGGADGR